MSDQGGGIPRDRTELLFNYMYSTAPRPPNPQAASTTPLVSIIKIMVNIIHLPEKEMIKISQTSIFV